MVSWRHPHSREHVRSFECYADPSPFTACCSSGFAPLLLESCCHILTPGLTDAVLLAPLLAGGQDVRGGSLSLGVELAALIEEGGEVIASFAVVGHGLGDGLGGRESTV